MISSEVEIRSFSHTALLSEEVIQQQDIIAFDAAAADALSPQSLIAGEPTPKAP